MVDVKINAEDKINAVSGLIKSSGETIEIENTYTGNSIVNFWIEAPSVVNGSVNFSGIVTNGFSGSETLFSLLIKAKKAGTAEFILSEVQALLNDGLGTSDTSSAKTLSLSIAEKPESVQPKIIEYPDTQPPEIFIPVISRSSELFNNQYFVVFETADKGVGIDRFQILEEKVYKLLGFQFKTGSWRDAKSPVLLFDQKLESSIYLKAIDKNGNTVTAELPPVHPIVWYENFLFWGIIILVVIFVAIFVLYAKRRKQNVS